MSPCKQCSILLSHMTGTLKVLDVSHSVAQLNINCHISHYCFLLSPGAASKRFGIDGDREAVPLMLEVVYNKVRSTSVDLKMCVLWLQSSQSVHCPLQSQPLLILLASLFETSASQNLALKYKFCWKGELRNCEVLDSVSLRFDWRFTGLRLLDYNISVLQFFFSHFPRNLGNKSFSPLASHSGGDQWEKPVEKRNQSLYFGELNQSLQESWGTGYVTAPGWGYTL